MSQDQLKRDVSKLAAAFAQSVLKPDDILGVGTGSTVNFFIDELARLELPIRGAYSSSQASTTRLQAIGIEVLNPHEWGQAALYVDGADEVDSHGALTKGAGGALTREKIVAAMSDRFLCIVDYTKVVEQLGAFPLPIESLSWARSHVRQQITKLGGEVVVRGQFVTDNGHEILDVHHLAIEDAAKLEVELNAIPGVVENGIFAKNRPFMVLVGHSCGVEAKASTTELKEWSGTLNALSVCCQTPLQ